ncbi:outer membrane protein assembly factor BamA [Natronospira bacteriovora]|uniref:Outer membrane protein assembly factor BamA n=1 Tax=Natronospira bacteriovora TaxID=3069753 RepID=A0ABU0W2U0_9GAMM|nr:outer membrane protein assembly factor BamA [Natronospira sp. AB-CW4]MDQ2068337.1 outer membrane protein assembly factor BamA [Natronospira sp. AB-CW4]
MRAGKSLLLSLLLLCFSVPLSAQEGSADFVVEDFRLEGLQRIAEETVLSYLPISVGDRVDQQRIRAGVRELYQTGFFDNIAMERDGGVLVVRVEERPTIARITLEGNRQIESDMLRQSMREQGIAEGRVLNEQVVSLLEQELYRTYYAQGRYGVDIIPSIREVGNNQVDLTIEIKEGRVAKIRQINVVGNQAFDDDQLRKQLELRRAGWRTIFSSRDQYSREKLGGDLETLRSYYMDRGYADFGIQSVQVAIGPDRRDVFLTVNVDEGDVYTVRDVNMVGEFPVPEEQLSPFIQTQPGDTFSLARANRSAEHIKQRLGASGYAHAEVTPVPDLHRDDKEVSLIFYVEPGERIYVREIRFSGSESTEDQVYRREMRQFEKAPLSNVSVNRSRLRMQRLPFVEFVDIQEVPVPGSSDEVDLEVNVRERNFGQFQVGVGYGGFTGLSLNASVQNNNLFGLGHRADIDIQSNALGDFYSVSHTDPYAGSHGVSRTVGGFYSKQDIFARGQSPVSTTSTGMNLRYGIPVSEFDSIRYGASVRRSEFLLQQGTSQEFREFIENHGESFERGGFTGSRMDSAEINLSWVRDTRNRAFMADRGQRRVIGLDVAVPNLDLEYYQARINQESYLRLSDEWTLRLDGELVYSDVYGDNTLELPPFKQVFAGGPTSVRGYQAARLGPTDEFGRPYGGTTKFNMQNELLLPNLFADDETQQPAQYRFFLFFDAGYVWEDIDDVDASDLRYSTGIGATWITPMGILRFSYARPINVRDEDRERNIIDRFQIDLGGSF